MSSYLDRRSALSGPLLHYLANRLITDGYPIMRSDGSLLAPGAKQITQSTPIDTMTIVQKFIFGHVNQPENYIALVFTRAQDGHLQVSIHTAPETARHVVKVIDGDVTASVSILKQLIDETLSEITGA